MPYKDPEQRRLRSLRSNAALKEKDPDYFKKHHLEWSQRPEVKEVRRFQTVKRLYNLNAEEYLQMILDQNNLCAICYKPETHKNRNGDVRPLNVDHCHITGKVRGLLCTHCNSTLGNAFDDVSILESCIQYLKEHREN